MVTIEKNPSVNILIGKLMKLRIGFKTKSITARHAPPVSKVTKPPVILNPGTSIGNKKRDSVFTPILLIILFTN